MAECKFEVGDHVVTTYDDSEGVVRGVEGGTFGLGQCSYEVQFQHDGRTDWIKEGLLRYA